MATTHPLAFTLAEVSALASDLTRLSVTHAVSEHRRKLLGLFLGPPRGRFGEMRSDPDRVHAGQGPFWVGALGGIRTPNLLIRSQMLYPLSYERRVAYRPRRV